MTRIIAFFNQKGGTAKTTSTLNTAAALSERGRSVLTVDLDPQSSLTMAMGVDITQVDASVYDVLLDPDVVVDDVITATTIPGVSLLPAHPDLAAAELELLNVLERERQLEQRLQSLDLSRFDFVLIDAPPSLNIISINILVAAQELIIPIEPHPLSIMVLTRLFETVSKIQRLNPELNVLGFLPTKVHSNSRLASDMLDLLAKQYQELPLLPSVPLSVRGAESTAERMSILQYMPQSPVATAYREVGAWLEQGKPFVPGGLTDSVIATEAVHA